MTKAEEETFERFMQALARTIGISQERLERIVYQGHTITGKTARRRTAAN